MSLPPLPPSTHLDRFPVLYSNFPLANYFTHDSAYVAASVHMSMLLFQFIPPCPLTAVSTSLFSISASPFLPYK